VYSPTLRPPPRPRLRRGARGARPRGACPNYPYPSISDRCVGAGFCGRVEPEAQASRTYVEPGPLESESADPLAFSHGATAGSGDNYAIVEASVGAGRSSIDVDASVDVTAPIFDGDLQVTENARAGMSPLRNVTATELLEGVDLGAVTEFSRGPFSVTTGVPLQLELWMESGAGALTTGGDGSSTLELTALLGPAGGGDIFDLPAGYSADSEQAGIAGNRIVRAPESGAPAAVGVLALAALARRRRLGRSARAPFHRG